MHADPDSFALPTTYDPVAQRVRTFGATVFAEFTALANATGAVNLGQGFPNFAAPDFVKEAAQAAIGSDLNQYARSAGHPRLVNALSQVYGPLFGRPLDPMQEIVVTVGATEGIFATVQALVNPGDEVILIEPFYDSYPAAVIMAGGTPVYVPLRGPAGSRSAAEWVLDMDELARLGLGREALPPLIEGGLIQAVDEPPAVFLAAPPDEVANAILELRKGAGQARLLDLRNSGDTAERRDTVVGYGAFHFGNGNPGAASP